MNGLEHPIQIIGSFDRSRIDPVLFQNISAHHNTALIEQRAVDRHLIGYTGHLASLQIVSQTFLNIRTVFIQQVIQRKQCTLGHKTGNVAAPDQSQINLLTASHHKVQLIVIGTIGYYLQL